MNKVYAAIGADALSPRPGRRGDHSVNASENRASTTMGRKDVIFEGLDDILDTLVDCRERDF